MPAEVTRDSRPRPSTMRAPSRVRIGSLPPVGKRDTPDALVWWSIVSVQSFAAGPSARAVR